ncbi:MAG: hypothetical protein WC300_06455 [Candidatus Omnitrophota bacterium]|jgi:hypothetical protein|nr:hypothetical protein [Candidatus Omnitrophota bacterium]
MQEYRFLSSARLVFKILSWLSLGIGIVSCIITLISGSNAQAVQALETAPRAAGFVFLIMGCIYFLVLYTISEMIRILLDIKKSCCKQSV